MERQLRGEPFRAFLDQSDFPFDDISVDDIQAWADDAAGSLDNQLGEMLESDELSWDSVMGALAHMSEQFGQKYGPIYVMGRVHPKKAVRKAALDAEVTLEKHDNKIWHSPDVYEKVKAFSETDGAQELSEERSRYLEKCLNYFQKIGHGIEGIDQSVVQAMFDELTEHETQFVDNIDNDKTRIELGRSALKGLPKWYLDTLQRSKQTGKYVIKPEMAHVNTVLAYATNRKTRSKVLVAKDNVAADTNRELLEIKLEKRQRLAKLLGYESWAHFRLEDCMLKNPEEVRAFYDELISAIRPKAKKELAIMTKMLRADGYDDQLQEYDAAFYATKLIEKKRKGKEVPIYEYFSFKATREAIFEMAGEFYGVSYERRKEAKVWHKDVEVYDVYQSQTGEHLSTLYMDVFARKGKLDAPFLMPVQSRREGVRPAMGMLIASFQKTPNDKQLLDFQDIWVLMHELGHFHDLTFGEAEIADFVVGDSGGVFLGRDYAEFASQVSEKWAEDPQVLHRLSKHFVTGKKLPMKVIKRYFESQKINQAIDKLSRFALHITDLEIHDNPDGKDLDEILRDTSKVSAFPYIKGTFGLGTFTHLTDYSALTSGYDVTEVFAYDAFESVVRPGGLTNRDTGDEFREKVLKVGGLKNGLDIVRGILGREPSAEAYLRKLGISK